MVLSGTIVMRPVPPVLILLTPVLCGRIPLHISILIQILFDGLYFASGKLLGGVYLLIRVHAGQGQSVPLGRVYPGILENVSGLIGHVLRRLQFPPDSAWVDVQLRFFMCAFCILEILTPPIPAVLCFRVDFFIQLFPRQ